MRGIDPHDVPVPCHRPVWSIHRTVNEMHRFVASQPGEEAAPGIVLVNIRIADVDLLDRHGPRVPMGLRPVIDRYWCVHGGLLLVLHPGMRTIMDEIPCTKLENTRFGSSINSM